MKMLKLFLGAISVAVLSLFYNYLIFAVFDFYPDVSDSLGFLGGNVFLVIFLKNFLTGFLLTYLFSRAYFYLNRQDSEPMAIVFFIFYSISALISFSLGDILLFESQEGLFVLLTIDGLVEMVIATIPVRLFYT